eukprot:1196013-Prorocentrum_minimum.AAC.3
MISQGGCSCLLPGQNFAAYQHSVVNSRKGSEEKELTLHGLALDKHILDALTLHAHAHKRQFLRAVTRSKEQRQGRDCRTIVGNDELLLGPKAPHRGYTARFPRHAACDAM